MSSWWWRLHPGDHTHTNHPPVLQLLDHPWEVRTAKKSSQHPTIGGTTNSSCHLPVLKQRLGGWVLFTSLICCLTFEKLVFFIFPCVAPREVWVSWRSWFFWLKSNFIRKRRLDFNNLQSAKISRCECQGVAVTKVMQFFWSMSYCWILLVHPHH